MREYSSKVDELIKDKLEAQNELKNKEKEEKEMVAKQVFLKFLCKIIIFAFFWKKKKMFTRNIWVLSRAEHVCSVAACFASTTGSGWRFCSTSNATTTNGWDGDAPNARLWNATHGLLIFELLAYSPLTKSCNFYMV